MLPNWNIKVFDCVESTMDVARNAVYTLSPNKNLLILAKEQTKGRGQKGRSWLPAEKALYATYVFPVEAFKSDLSPFTLVSALCLYKVLNGAALNLLIKWPNDLLTKDNKKIAGILAESYSFRGRKFFAVGIGLNIKSAPLELQSVSDLMSLTRSIADIDNIALKVAYELEKSWHIYLEEGFVYFRQEWNNASWKLGKRIDIASSGNLYQGEFMGVDEQACLMLNVDNRIIRLSSAEIETYVDSN